MMKLLSGSVMPADLATVMPSPAALAASLSSVCTFMRSSTLLPTPAKKAARLSPTASPARSDRLCSLSPQPARTSALKRHADRDLRFINHSQNTDRMGGVATLSACRCGGTLMADCQAG